MNKSQVQHLKCNRESINFTNLIKYWIKLKTVDSNHQNFGLISEKRYQLQKLLFEKGLLALDTEFLVLEQKFFFLINCLDVKNREFCGKIGEHFTMNKSFINQKATDEEYWIQTVQMNIQHHQTYELVKLNITDLITQWTRLCNEIWIYNDQFHYQTLFRHKLEQYKLKIRSFQCTIVHKLIENLFNSMYGLIKCHDFDKKEECLEIVQTILIQLTIEIEVYFKLKRKSSKIIGYESFSLTIIKRIAYLNSRRCNLNFANSSTIEHLNSEAERRNSMDLMGFIRDSEIDKRKWFADLNDLGLIDVNRKLFEKFTDHSFRSWFQPDDQSSFNSSNDQSVDKSIDKIYDKSYNKSFEKAHAKDKKDHTKSTGKTVIIPSKFNELINKQQMLNLSYHSLQLITSEPSSKIIDYLEKVYWNRFWFNLNFRIQYSSVKTIFQRLMDDEFDSKVRTNQFQKLLENIKSDFFVEKMFGQFYDFKSIHHKQREEMMSKGLLYISSVSKLCSSHVIKVNTEVQKANSFLFILQIEDTFNTLAKMVERVTYFRDQEELIFILIHVETINEKIKLIENSISSERNFTYSNFFSKIQIHLLNRLDLLLEYRICNSINKNYAMLNSPALKPNDWMQKLIDEVFSSILKFKQNKPSAAVQKRIEQMYIRKFNLFLIKIYDLTMKKKSNENLKAGVHFYMNWINVEYEQHIKADNFPSDFLDLINSNLNFESSDNMFNVNRKSLINRNQIAPQSIYETKKIDSSHYTSEQRNSFRHVHFRTDAEHRLKISNRKSYLKLFFCFDTST